MFTRSQTDFLNQIQSSIRQLPQSSTSTLPAALIPNFEPFSAERETFKVYKERFKNYLVLKGVFDQKPVCLQIFINSIGPTYYGLLTSLISPKTLDQCSYEEVLTILENHLCPKQNFLVSQHKFLSTFQGEDNISKFLTTLRGQLQDCEFSCKCDAGMPETFLRAQFIRGLRDNSIREQLLQAENTSLDNIITKALAIEASRLDSKIISNEHPDDDQQVHKLTLRSKSRSPELRQHHKTRSKSKVNFRELGIDNLCLRCGASSHRVKECRSDPSKFKCSGCLRTGHIQKVCIKTLLEANQPYENHSVDDYGIHKIVDIFNQKPLIDLQPVVDSSKFYVTVKLQGQPTTFEVDSGAGFTLMPRSSFNLLNLNIPLQSTNIMFRSYTGNVFKPQGKLMVNVQYGRRSSQQELYIVSDDFQPLLGRIWIRQLGINLSDIDRLNTNAANVNKVDSVNCLFNKYASIFEQRIGCIPNVTCSLHLKEESKPKFVRDRAVPYALRDAVEKELNELELAQIITKVNHSDWGSPLVCVPKINNQVRLCVDYKIGVNPQLQAAHHPIMRIDEIISKLRDASYFCRLDLFKAYLHVKVDDESAKIQTISTHRGTYLMNRLSFGIKTAPSEFNRIMEQVLQNLEGTMSYFDDIIVFGKTKEECYQRLEKCFERLQQHDLHLNKNKCEFFKTEIRYLGHVIGHNKVCKGPDKVAAVLELPQPKSKDDIKRFLGMVAYYSRFIPNCASKTYPLRNLLKRNLKFKWTEICEKAFQDLKREIASDRVLIPYDPDLPIVLTCDGSPTGVAGVLSHIINGSERPIAFASRSLTPAEQNYSQLDREALAIIFSVSHFYMYLFGRQFELITDNQPLVRIFHQSNKLPAMTSARLLRYASFLSGFDYVTKFKKGFDNTNVDCLSRAPITHLKKTTDISINQEVHQLCQDTIFTISSVMITAETIAKETEKDAELRQIKNDLLNGTSNQDSYILDGDILFKGQRVVIPQSLQADILSELHCTHMGTTRMKQLARRYCYWSGIDKDIEDIVKSCNSCCYTRASPPKENNHPWEEPDTNWSRVHIDYAGPYEGKYLLIAVDAKSKWAEVKISNTPSTSSTINLLRTIFSGHGFPQVLVSDNASIFRSEVMTNWCTTHGIFQKFIAPGHPATNGLAERYVRTLKTKLNSMKADGQSLLQKVENILILYRATPLTNGLSPAEQYLGRRFRIRLDAIKPYHEIRNSIHKSYPQRHFSVGDRVMSRTYINNKDTWSLGTVSKKLGILHYMVTLDNGYVYKRHIDQLRSTSIKKVRFADQVQREKQDTNEIIQPKVLNPLPSPSEQLFYFNPPSYIQNHGSLEDNDNQQSPERAERPEPFNDQRPQRERRAPGYLADYI